MNAGRQTNIFNSALTPRLGTETVQQGVMQVIPDWHGFLHAIPDWNQGEKMWLNSGHHPCIVK